MMRDWLPDVMYPDLSTPAGLRIMLAARYQHLVLKFTVPPVSEKFEVSWIGGSAVADSEDELLAKVLEELQDCGSERHDWLTISDQPDPNNPDNVLRSQRLKCIYCDSRERVITISSPPPGDVQSVTGDLQGVCLPAPASYGSRRKLRLVTN